MNLSSLIPSPYRWLVLAVLGAALLAFGALQGARWQENVDAVQIARLQAAGDQERARLAAAALARASANAAETARRIAAMEENQRDQDRLLARMRRDRDDAFAAADRLREQSAAAPVSGVPDSLIPPLPATSRQPPAPSSCSSTCAAGWSELVQSLPPTPMPPARPAASASPTTRREEAPLTCAPLSPSCWPSSP